MHDEVTYGHKRLQHLTNNKSMLICIKSSRKQISSTLIWFLPPWTLLVRQQQAITTDVTLFVSMLILSSRTILLPCTWHRQTGATYARVPVSPTQRANCRAPEMPGRAEAISASGSQLHMTDGQSLVPSGEQVFFLFAVTRGWSLGRGGYQTATR